MTPPKAVILNDTSTRYHHGCTRVVRLLTEGLAAQGFQITARSPARNDWLLDKAFMAALAQAQVVVINGEGTFHDRAEGATKLLAITDHTTKPVALINALYENNPASWHRQIAACALLSARDSRSAAELSRAADRPVSWTFDLSLSAPAGTAPTLRHGLIVGDSVRLDRRKILARAARRLHATWIPTKTLSNPFLGTGLIRNTLWRAYNGTFTGPVPTIALPPSETAYLAALAAATGHLTGRFHAVCLSLLTETPFRALGSKTSKIETLLTDAGLGPDRLITAEELETLTPAELASPFTQAELDAICTTRAAARDGAQALFAAIRALA
ncbi:MAG: polysaccharide pyruvyl transferase family protein [Rhodobacterales bacterium]|nr:polysaccharide pyruvyl transferase family protein [Rhodobacterales bacterium]